MSFAVRGTCYCGRFCGRGAAGDIASDLRQGHSQEKRGPGCKGAGLAHGAPLREGTTFVRLNFVVHGEVAFFFYWKKGEKGSRYQGDCRYLSDREKATQTHEGIALQF